MVVLTWVWYKCVAREHAKLKEKIENEMGEGPGAVKLTGDESLFVEQKV